MTRRYSAKLPVLVGLLGVSCPRPAMAGDRPCAAMAVEANANVRLRWPELPDRIREAFDARSDIDACARISLIMSNASVIVEVVLPDGRSASRSVSRREDVVPTLEALLLVPQREEQQQTDVLEPSVTASPPVPAIAATLHDPRASSPSPANVPTSSGTATADRDAPPRFAGYQPSRLRIELSAVTGARFGDGQTGVGLGALSFLDIGGWLVGFEGRADRYQTIVSNPPVGVGAALELALLAGRRFRFQTLSLDLAGGAAAALQGTSTYSTMGPTGQFTESSSSTVPRLLLGARLNFNALSSLRTFVGVDGEMGPSRAGPDLPGGSPQLPHWTLGLALGATVGTQ